jgi:hypothetical protein
MTTNLEIFNSGYRLMNNLPSSGMGYCAVGIKLAIDVSNFKGRVYALSGSTPKILVSSKDVPGSKRGCKK